MIVRTLDEITDTERDVESENKQWRSKRIVLAKDGVGFSVHETVLQPGTINDFWYANHIEAVFVTEGEGELYDKDNDVTYQLAPGLDLRAEREREAPAAAQDADADGLRVQPAGHRPRGARRERRLPADHRVTTG